MATSHLGRTLLIANPAAHSGAGARATDFAERFFSSYASLTSSFRAMRTQGPDDAREWAADASDADTVVALGGDGLIHEVVGGLMELPRDLRPALAVLPSGTGNDYARTLGMARNDVERALGQIASGVRRRVEVGRVNGVHFMQTLSFGMDAAIALDTTDKRAAGTRERGERLFISSAVSIMAAGTRGCPARVSFDGEPAEDFSCVIFAVQVGPTYGAGFAICPKARPDDGLLDVCHSVAHPSTPHLLALLGLARFGLHTGSRMVRLRTIRHAEVEFTAEEPPCQVDGERLTGTRYVIDVVPDALEVLAPAACPW